MGRLFGEVDGGLWEGLVAGGGGLWLGLGGGVVDVGRAGRLDHR